jgi:hypothetical protein
MQSLNLLIRIMEVCVLVQEWNRVACVTVLLPGTLPCFYAALYFVCICRLLMEVSLVDADFLQVPD